MANEFTDYPAAIKPHTECILAKVPMSGNNKDIYLATSASAYESWVRGKKVASETDFSYQRANSIIRYPGNMEDILNSGANYVMWVNKDFNGKVFYAYITRLEYKNPNVTWIHIDIDVINTFIYGIKMGTQYVERMIPKTDKLYEHLIPEGLPVSDSAYVYNIKKETQWKVQDYVTGVLFSDKDTLVSAPNVHEYDGLLTQYKLVVCNTKENLKEILDALSWDFTREIVAAYAIPSFCVPLSTSLPNIPDGSKAETRTLKFDKISGGLAFEGYPEKYIPINWKLYNAPYCMFYISNGINSSMSLEYEYFTENTPEFTLSGGLIQPVSASIFPVNYKKSTLNTGDISLKICDYPQLAVSEGSQQSIVTAAAIGAVSLAAAGIGSGFLGSVISGAGSTFKEALGREGYGIYGASMQAIKTLGYSVTDEQSSELSNAAMSAVQNTVLAYILSGKSSNAVGNSASIAPALYKNGQLGIYTGTKMLSAPIAKKLDEYFSKYGYLIEGTEEIDLFSNRRSVFNYYQTKECNINANIPSDFRIKMQQIFDNGVRFWYDEVKFCDYSRNTLEENAGTH